MKRRSFTLVEFLIILAIVAFLAIIIVLVINPSKTLIKSRDGQRNADMTDLATATDLYLADNKDFVNLKGPYSSLSSLGQSNNGSGWLPLKFNTISSGAPIDLLPKDPLNRDSYYYTFAVNPKTKTYEINCVFELPDNIAKESTDGGNNINAYEVGTDLTLLP